MFRRKSNPLPQYEIAAGNAMRGLVQRLSFGVNKPVPRIVAFIAARPREGTSTMARNYAVALASQSDQKVLLINADPMAPDRFRSYSGDVLGAIVDPTLTQPMPRMDEDDKTQPQQPEQSVLVGRWRGNDAAASRSIVIHNSVFWNNLLDSYDSLVIDAPSLRASFDGISVAAKADATVIVVEAEKTPQPVVEHLRDTLAAAGAVTAGIVMNKRRFYIPRRVYKKL